MGKLVLRPLQEGDLEFMVDHMREAEREEITSSAGPDLLDTLQRSAAASVYGGAATVDDEVVFIWGICPVSLIGKQAIPWMIGTDKIAKVGSALTRATREHIAQVRGTYPQLFNMVDVRNTHSIRWLKRLGFKMREPVPFGLEGRLFHPFDMGFDNV